jgi:hypothetical protein
MESLRSRLKKVAGECPKTGWQPTLEGIELATSVRAERREAVRSWAMTAAKPGAWKGDKGDAGSERCCNCIIHNQGWLRCRSAHGPTFEWATAGCVGGGLWVPMFAFTSPLNVLRLALPRVAGERMPTNPLEADNRGSIWQTPRVPGLAVHPEISARPCLNNTLFNPPAHRRAKTKV